MRELRFVMPSEDDTHVVVEAGSNVGTERFRLPITDELRAAVRPPPTESGAQEAEALEVASPAEPSTRDSMPAAKAAAAEPPSISPREIQVRVRSGELPEAIAASFDASLDWVMRFAGPVIEERGRLTDEARRARARRSTADAQTVIFGETVDSRFHGHGIDPALVRWDSHRRADGQWVITAQWTGGDSERTAEWAFNLAGRTVTPIDETAADLLSDRPIRPAFTEPPVTLSSAPPLAPGVVAFPAQPGALTGPLPTREQLFDQHDFREPPPSPLRPVAALPVRDVFDAEPLPLELDLDLDLAPGPQADDVVEIDDTIADLDTALIEQVVEHEPTACLPQVTNLGVAHRPATGGGRGETEDEKAARAHIPSWDDILLGVRRKND